MIGFCKNCKKFSFSIKNRRLNTQYFEEDRNWIVSCNKCYNDICEIIQGWWNDYWSGIL